MEKLKAGKEYIHKSELSTTLLANADLKQKLADAESNYQQQYMTTLDIRRHLGIESKVTKDLLLANARLVEVAKETIEEIKYWHANMLSDKERNHPRGNGWARVFDKLNNAISTNPDTNQNPL